MCISYAFEKHLTRDGLYACIVFQAQVFVCLVTGP
jgi:hypothetical protein